MQQFFKYYMIFKEGNQVNKDGGSTSKYWLLSGDSIVLRTEVQFIQP